MIRNVLTGILVVLVFVLAGCGETDETTGAISVESKKTVEQPIETPSEKLLGQSIEELSDTDLLDQSGDGFSFRSRTGTPFLLSFIFTRCPDPGMCPLVTQKMQRLGRTDLAARIGLELVAVTIEPEYDTPPVLRTYAEERKLDPERWYLVTGPTRTIDNLTNQLHVSVLRENEAVKTHNMRTYFVDETGVIRDVWTGSDWEPSSVEESIRKRTESN
jgi:protein SCO1/2